jgi:hypothetical protein
MIATLALSALLLGTPVPPAGAAGQTMLHLVQETEAVPERPRRPVRRRAARRRAAPPAAETPPPLPPAPPAAPRADIAPMPNRSLEAPRQPYTGDAVRIRPEFIEPRRLPDTRAQPGNDYTQRQDSLFRDPAPGARLQIPFSY